MSRITSTLETDGGDPDGTETPTKATLWNEVGCELLQAQLAEHRLTLQDAYREAEQTIYGEYDGTGKHSGEITPEHVHALRQALNEARRELEQFVAPAAGLEPWGEPRPEMPWSVLYEMSDHPRAHGVDPWEYVDAEPPADTDPEGKDE
jgi:hypothetical protein